MSLRKSSVYVSAQLVEVEYVGLYSRCVRGTVRCDRWVRSDAFIACGSNGGHAF